MGFHLERSLQAPTLRFLFLPLESPPALLRASLGDTPAAAAAAAARLLSAARVLLLRSASALSPKLALAAAAAATAAALAAAFDLCSFPRSFPKGLCSEPLGLGAGGLGVHGLGALAGVEGVRGAGLEDGDSLSADGDAIAPTAAPVGDIPAAVGADLDDGPGAAAVPAPSAVGDMSTISSSNRFRLMARELLLLLLSSSAEADRPISCGGGEKPAKPPLKVFI